MKKLLLLLAVLLQTALLLAQSVPTGGVKGRVLSKTDRTPVDKASVRLMSGAAVLTEVQTDAKGQFQIPEVEDGSYTLVFLAAGYLENRMPVMVAGGKVKNVFNVNLSSVNHSTDSYPGAFTGSTDIFENLSSYLEMRHPSSGEVTLAGVVLDADYKVLGYGLTESMRASTFISGSGLADDAFGGIRGSAALDGTAGAVRTGFRGSLGTDASLYGLQATASYATGPLKGGWTVAADASARGWERVGLSAFSYYIGADKVFSPSHKLSAAVFRAVEPISFLRYDFTPSARFRLYLTALGRFSSSGGASLATGFSWRAGKHFTLQGGADGMLGLYDRNSSYRVMAWTGGRLTFGRLGLNAGLRLTGSNLEGYNNLYYAAKAGVVYWLGESMQASLNAVYSRPDMVLSKTLSTDANLTMNSNGIHFRITGFFLSDLEAGSKKWGTELALKSPLFVVPNLFFQGMATAMTAVPFSFYGGFSWAPKSWFADAGVLRFNQMWLADVSAGKTWLLEGGHQLGLTVGCRPFFQNFRGSRYMLRLFVKI